MTNVKIIADLVLPNPEEYEKLKTSVTSAEDSSESVPLLQANKSAQINAGSICVFDSTLTNQNRSDVSNSILFAQLASNKKFNRFTESSDWYNFYTSTLANIGWGNSDFAFDNYNSTTIDWENIVLERMARVATENEIALARTGMDAWQYLQINGKGMTIWNANTVLENNENFQIIAVDIANNGDVVMAIGAIESQALKSPDGFLSWKTEYCLKRGASKLVLNESVYSKIRQLIIDKLGDKPLTFVANLPLKSVTLNM